MSWWTEAAGSQLPCYETIAARDAAYPAPVLGQKVGMRRLCGNGYFEQMFNGTRWESFGSIISDSGAGGDGYTLTATVANAAVLMASYNAPAGIFGIGEEWRTTIFIKNVVYSSGTDYAAIQIAGTGVLSAVGVTSVDRVSHGQGVFMNEKNNTLVRRRDSGLEYADRNIDDVAVNFAGALTLSALLIGGAISNTVKIRQWGITRIL